MKKTLLKLASVAALVFAVASTVSAAPINGYIGFTGSAVLDSDISTATEASNVSMFALNATGAFSGIANFTAVDFGPDVWEFASGPVANFWQVGGFTFDLTSSWVTTQNGSTLGVTGVGIISAVGYDPTPGNWFFSTQGAGNSGIFTFSAESRSVPDGGTTAALLGAALVGMSLLARRRAA